MHRRTLLGLLSALPFAPRALSQPGDGPAAGDWKKIPPSANSLLVADVRTLYQSAIGQKEGWARRYNESFHAGLSALPPTVERVTVAAQYDFGFLEPHWLLGLIRSGWLITLGDIAKAEGSSIGRVGDRSAVRSPRNAFFTSSGDREIAVFSPADRQAFARWMRVGLGEGYARQNEYLAKAAADGSSAHLLVAADLIDVVDAESAQLYMVHLPTAQRLRLNGPNMARLFAGIRGFRLEVMATDVLSAKLMIDFSTPIGNLGPHLPDLLDDLLADGGAILDDIKEWKPTLSERTLTLEGRMSPASLNRLLMLFELPGSPERDRPDRTGEARANALASLKYFRSINDLLTELRGVRFIDNYERYAMWFDKYARKIDQLPMQGVDEELLGLSYHLASRLRATAASLRGIPLKKQEISEGAYAFQSSAWSGNRRWGAVALGPLQTNIPESRAAIAKIVREDQDARNELWKRTDDEIAATRQRMTAKYKINF